MLFFIQRKEDFCLATSVSGCSLIDRPESVANIQNCPQSFPLGAHKLKNEGSILLIPLFYPHK